MAIPDPNSIVATKEYYATSSGASFGFWFFGAAVTAAVGGGVFYLTKRRCVHRVAQRGALLWFRQCVSCVGLRMYLCFFVCLCAVLASVAFTRASLVCFPYTSRQHCQARPNVHALVCGAVQRYRACPCAHALFVMRLCGVCLCVDCSPGSFSFARTGAGAAGQGLTKGAYGT